MVVAAAIRLGTQGTKKAARGLGEGGAGDGGSSRDPLDAIGGTFETAFKTVIKPLLDAVTALLGIMAIGVFKYLKGMFDFLTNPLGFLEKKAKEAAEDPIAAALDNLPGVGGNLISGVVSKFFDGLKEEAKEETEGLKEGTTKDYEEMAKNIGTLSDGMKEKMKKDFDSLVQGVTGAASGLSTFVVDTFQGINEGVGNAISELLTKINSFFRGQGSFSGFTPGGRSEIGANFSTLEGSELNTLAGANFQSITGENQQVTGSGQVINFYGLTMDEAITKVKTELGTDQVSRGSF